MLSLKDFSGFKILEEKFYWQVFEICYYSSSICILGDKLTSLARKVREFLLKFNKTELNLIRAKNEYCRFLSFSL